ncbi:MAG: hypothetical protein M0R80_03670 [Proteobacteria bacterium]|jgi:hypothetical protein|nr:hypothetical protein [Pseudomonadota bacterium]
MITRSGFVSNSSSSSFIISGKGTDKFDLINRFKEEMTNWIEKVANRFEEHGLEEYDARGNLKEVRITITSESDDKFESSLTRLENLELKTIEIGRIYIGDRRDY